VVHGWWTSKKISHIPVPNFCHWNFFKAFYEAILNYYLWWNQKMSLVKTSPHNSAGALPSRTHFHPNVRILVLSFYYFIRMYSRNFLFVRPYSLSIESKRTYSRFFLNSYVHIRGSFHFKRTYSRSFLFIRTYSRTESRASFILRL
jgi:hypothetical protein